MLQGAFMPGYILCHTFVLTLIQSVVCGVQLAVKAPLPQECLHQKDHYDHYVPAILANLPHARVINLLGVQR